MSILVVDDFPANVKLLEARLAEDYFDVITASTSEEALAICFRAIESVDLLLIGDLPDHANLSLCDKIRRDPRTQHIPILILTKLDAVSDRMKGLELGADDVLAKPVADAALITRVRSLLKLKEALDELRTQSEELRDLEVQRQIVRARNDDGRSGRVLISGDTALQDNLASILREEQKVERAERYDETLFQLAEGDFDLFISPLEVAPFDTLKLFASIRNLQRTRHVPMLGLLKTSENPLLLTRALAVGVNDYLTNPIHAEELILRSRNLIRRKRLSDTIRKNTNSVVAMSLTDVHTGLYNWHYGKDQVQLLLKEACERGNPLALLLADLDHLKEINDKYGHLVGTEVLLGLAGRFQKSLRGMDIAIRYAEHGDEFVLALPLTSPDVALKIADRLRSQIEGEPFLAEGGKQHIAATISIGVTNNCGREEMAESLLKRADEALYIAKREGRNRIESNFVTWIGIERFEQRVAGELTCLVVDDSDVLRKTIGKIARSLGLEVTEVDTVGKAELFCERARPNLVLLHKSGPEKTVIDALRVLRRGPDSDRMKIIVYGDTDLRSIQESFHAGADEYIMKPLDRDIIAAKLQVVGIALKSVEVTR
ncbi:response regulator [Bradyrhizobium diazoefficiens]|uniref:response regulator n=1 Tax=Bradyrhizobium diazoefficiens TaxID=1355477 RepID=UPI0004B8E26E|nr:response regulator [Bradyrhizobium diazoefficiens]